MGGGGKGGSQTTTTEVKLPKWIEDVAKQNIGIANEVATTRPACPHPITAISATVLTSYGITDADRSRPAARRNLTSAD